MRFSIEPWAPDYASPFDSDAPVEPGGAPAADVEESVEAAVGSWAAIRPPVPAAHPTVLFVDGVQRIDAWVWAADGTGATRPGICASYAAGIIRCDGRAEIVEIEVRRGLFSPAPAAPIRSRHVEYKPCAATGETPEQLRHAVQQRMGELEAEIAHRAGEAAMIVVDGPLRGRQNVPGAVGYIKAHHVRYLSDEGHGVVAALQPGERTPLFLMATSWTRYSWYARLPGPGSQPWAGIVRCEASADLPVAEAARLADLVAATLPRFASAAHKDPRAPQNLYPIAGLERAMKHRMGDAALLYRELRMAAEQSARAGV